ncbi:MAG: hypothetical protein ACOX9C_07690 [Kiritimatiellia bacterium]|jgi:hypothetical protein
MKKSLLTLLLPTAIIASLGLGCIRTTHKIEPIHITMDINLKVDRALDDFFGDIDSAPVKPIEPAKPAEAAAPVEASVATEASTTVDPAPEPAAESAEPAAEPVAEATEPAVEAPAPAESTAETADAPAETPSSTDAPVKEEN